MVTTRPPDKRIAYDIDGTVAAGSGAEGLTVTPIYRVG